MIERNPGYGEAFEEAVQDLQLPDEDLVAIEAAASLIEAYAAGLRTHPTVDKVMEAENSILIVCYMIARNLYNHVVFNTDLPHNVKLFADDLCQYCEAHLDGNPQKVWDTDLILQAAVQQYWNEQEDEEVA